MMKRIPRRIHRKDLLPIPDCASILYRQAADHLRRFYHRSPSAHTLMLLAVRRQGLEQIIEDFRGWNDLTRKYSLLTPRQRGQFQKECLLEE